MIVKMILPKIKRLLDTSVFDFVFRKPDRIILFYNKTNIVMQIKLDNLNVQIFFNSIDLFFSAGREKETPSKVFIFPSQSPSRVWKRSPRDGQRR